MPMKPQLELLFMVIGIIPTISWAFSYYVHYPLCDTGHTTGYSWKPSPVGIHGQHQRHFVNQQTSFSRVPCNMHKSSTTSTTLRSTFLSSLAESGVTRDINVNIPTLLIQTLSGLCTYIGLVAYYDKPRGTLQIDQSSFTLKQSLVENAGLGLYVTCALSKGTILGTYPGVVRPSSKYLQKYETVPQTSVYTWRFTDNQSCVDPTNKDGLLLDQCYGGTDDYPFSYFIHEQLFRWSVPTLLARINEPPIGGSGCNVMATENLEKREVVFELSRDVFAGEELFMDYGLTYDRTAYQ